MILGQFQNWARTAPAVGRANGVSALARAFLYSSLGEARRDTLLVLTEFLDDPSPLVRRALAEALADASHAPRHLIVALADDQADIAATVLARSPVLTDAELIDCAASADAVAQTAIASRTNLSAAVVGALAEIAAAPALTVLAQNHGYDLPEFSIRRMVERHGDHAELREALLVRPDLPAAIRIDLVAATTAALAAFVTSRNWMSDDRMKRVAAEARDKATITIAGAARGAQATLVGHLRRSGQLTVGLALRALLSGRLELFKAILSELSGTPLARVDGLATRCDGAGFAALYSRAGLPDDLLPAFRVALRAAQDADETSGTQLSRSTIERVLTACDEVNSGGLDKLIVLLRRFESEAARDEARNAAHVAIARSASVHAHEPLLLRDLDEVEERTPSHWPLAQTVPLRVAPTYTIDLAAIELELCAA